MANPPSSQQRWVVAAHLPYLPAWNWLDSRARPVEAKPEPCRPSAKAADGCRLGRLLLHGERRSPGVGGALARSNRSRWQEWLDGRSDGGFEVVMSSIQLELTGSEMLPIALVSPRGKRQQMTTVEMEITTRRPVTPPSHIFPLSLPSCGLPAAGACMKYSLDYRALLTEGSCISTQGEHPVIVCSSLHCSTGERRR